MGFEADKWGIIWNKLALKSITNLDGGVERWAEDVEKTMKRY